MAPPRRPAPPRTTQDIAERMLADIDEAPVDEPTGTGRRLEVVQTPVELEPAFYSGDEGEGLTDVYLDPFDALAVSGPGVDRSGTGEVRTALRPERRAPAEAEDQPWRVPPTSASEPPKNVTLKPRASSAPSNRPHETAISALTSWLDEPGASEHDGPDPASDGHHQSTAPRAAPIPEARRRAGPRLTSNRLGWALVVVLVFFIIALVTARHDDRRASVSAPSPLSRPRSSTALTRAPRSSTATKRRVRAVRVRARHPTAARRDRMPARPQPTTSRRPVKVRAAAATTVAPQRSVAVRRAPVSLAAQGPAASRRSSPWSGEFTP